MRSGRREEEEQIRTRTTSALIGALYLLSTLAVGCGDDDESPGRAGELAALTHPLAYVVSECTEDSQSASFKQRLEILR